MDISMLIIHSNGIISMLININGTNGYLNVN